MKVTEFRRLIAEKKAGGKKRAAKRASKPEKPADLFPLFCEAAGLPKPVKEFQFAKDAGRRWRFDYFFQDGGVSVALEVEGGIYTGGRHTRGKGFEGDMEKYNEAACRGIYVVRCAPKNLMEAGTINIVKRVLENGKEKG